MQIPFLGNINANEFLRIYWQKKPLLIRGAFVGLDEPFTPRQILQLAADERSECRLIQHGRGKWQVEHGPLSVAQIKRLPKRNWTILVQDTQHFSRAAATLLQQFSFIPHARVDDLMVSYAAPGGGVGPHFDSYDVFLLQGSGRRRWRISAQRDLALQPGAPLKILSRFKAQQEWVLEKGDMLYLPPGYAHEGVALDECLTYSIGFRAPSNQELTTAFVDFLRDELNMPGQYADTALRATTRPGEIPPAMRSGLKKSLRQIRWDDALMERFIGCYLSEPKAHVFFDAPHSPLTPKQFARQARLRGLTLDLKSRMLYCGEYIFINSESFHAAGEDVVLLRALADQRALLPGCLTHTGSALLYDWYLQGYLHPNT